MIGVKINPRKGENNMNKTISNPLIVQFTRAEELPVMKMGEALNGTGKYQSVLPFEVMCVLLLACMIGAIMIARKRK